LYKFPHIREFSKNSKYYHNYNFLQKEIAKELIKKVNFQPKKILDIGCGDGVVYSMVDWEFEKFVGVDFSKEMLSLHQKGEKIFLLQRDFDRLDSLFYKKFDLVVSSSSLQWSKNIVKMIDKIQKNSKNFVVAFFCNGTFKSLREWFSLETFLPNKKDILSILDRNIFYETKKYSLRFNSTIEQLRYIKRSGVSGGVRKVSVKKLRDFIKSYDKKELEFEVVFMIKTP
jgi:malonyl-CoA O-methyltransferase